MIRSGASGIGKYYWEGERIRREFQHIGSQRSFALPVSLVSSTSAVASTVRVKLRTHQQKAQIPRRGVELPRSGYL